MEEQKGKADQLLLKIATYNIARGHNFEEYHETGKPIFNLIKTAKFIHTFDADVITLNEVVSCCATDSRRVDETGQIAKLCEYSSYQFAQGVLFPSGHDLGNALLSRYPISTVRSIPVPAPTVEERRKDENDWYEDRVILCCMLEAFDTKIRYITTHFGLNKQEKERMMLHLCRLLDETDMPTVLSGDFNDLPHSELLQPIYDRLRSAADVMGVTDCTLCEPMELPQTVDYIFVSKHFEVLDYCVWKRVLSDHYPCMASIRLRQEFQGGNT